MHGNHAPAEELAKLTPEELALVKTPWSKITDREEKTRKENLLIRMYQAVKEENKRLDKERKESIAEWKSKNPPRCPRPIEVTPVVAKRWREEWLSSGMDKLYTREQWMELKKKESRAAQIARWEAKKLKWQQENS